jgi:6-phosphogluconolactonase
VADDLHTLDISTPPRWAERAADVMAAAITQAINRSGRCLLALSGGSTPFPAFQALADREVLWEHVTILQVDERLVSADDPARNLIGQRDALGHLGATWLPLPVDELLALPEDGFDDGAAEVLDGFAADLVGLADDPPVLDLVHLGLGDDGHTASLFPGDPLTEELRAYVGLTGVHNGVRRISLTRPLLDRARMAVWLVRGPSKAEPLGRLLGGDLSIPAGLIRPAHSVVLADAEAARQG